MTKLFLRWNTIMMMTWVLVCFTCSSTADPFLDDIQLSKSLKSSYSPLHHHITPNKNNHWFDLKIPQCIWITGILKCEDDQDHLDLSCTRPLNLPFASLNISKFRHLKYLNLSRCAFFGEIDDELWDLQYLEIIDLSHNTLSGTIPPSISKLKSLRRLILDHNHFSGTLPSEIGELAHRLIELSLHSNSFSGELPDELGNLHELESLDLSGNAFTGNLPKSMSNLSNLKYFSAHQNQLTGPLFSEIGGMLKLRILDLGWNLLNGNIPSSVGNLTRLRALDLGNCLFNGYVPEEISNLTRLMYLNLGANDFNGSELPWRIGSLIDLVYLLAPRAGLTGNIPWQLGNCKKLKVINISFNFVSGPLPDGLKGLKSLNSLDVSSNSLSGPIPLWISNWKELVSISLSENLFSGSLPPSLLSELPILSHFDASANNLSGELPPKICNDDDQSSLATLDLSRNNFSGPIKNAFNACLSLRNLILNENNLSGELPSHFGELQLVILEISNNKLTGEIPDRLWESKTLMEISLSDNFLQDPISDAISNVLTLERLQLDNNLLNGKIPRSIGKLKNLTNLSLHGNSLTGDIPSELFDCTQLVSLDLGSNQIEGKIPKAVSQLKFLDNLVLSGNRISGVIPEEICWSGFQRDVPIPDSEFRQHYGMLDLSNNELEGPIPASVKNCAVLTHLLLQGNKLNGTIPGQEIASLANLTVLDLSSNHLSGSVHPQLFHMRRLQGLILAHNRLNGSIPDLEPLSVFSLTKLNLSNNGFTGSLPPSLFSIRSLIYLDVSMNYISGPISIGIESRGSLIVLNASNNRFSGHLDDSISNLTSLSLLDLHANIFTGHIPVSFSNLAALTYLDLSENQFQLDSTFPCNICLIEGLSYANFSGNRINYNHVQKSCWDQSTCDILGLHKYNLSSDHPRQDNNSPAIITSHGSSLFWVLVVAILGLALLIGFLLKWKMMQRHENSIMVENTPADKKKILADIAVPGDASPKSDEGLLWNNNNKTNKKRKAPLSINLATFEHLLWRVNAADIVSATENFSDGYIIGDGGYGTVYKASLQGGRTLAVKRLNYGHSLSGQREFMAEMETLGKVKHDNLVPLLGYCVFEEERFLIYEYMENGSLDLWLRRNEGLDWPTRFDICLGSARGLAFLHHGFVTHIIHRDIKSSNILLDGDFHPKVSDFGLARIIRAWESHVSTMLAGTFGYIPPEYGQRMTATTKGDVYSFGVVMLELVTGREPTGQAEGEGGNLVGWVRWMVGNGREEEILDSRIAGCCGYCWKDEMLYVGSIARLCTHDKPWMRPTMLEVVKLLKHTRIMKIPSDRLANL